MSEMRIEIRAQTDVAKITLHGVPDEPGIAGEVFSCLGQAGHTVELVVSAGAGKGRADISLVVRESELETVLASLGKIRHKVGARDVAHDRGVALVSAVGSGLAGTPGVAGRMFRTLSAVGINIDLISTSIASVTCVIPRGAAEKGMEALRREFGLASSASPAP